MKFLRTAPTRTLLTVIAAALVAIVAGTAIAVAATSGGPVPPRKSLAAAVHQALVAPAVNGITARIKFTDNLIDSSDFTSQTVDPILQGASGRLWLSDDHRLRLELQSNDGDAQVIVNQGSFWISDPATHTVYEGTLPADSKSPSAKPKSDAVPSVAKIQSNLNRLMRNVNVSGASVPSAPPTRSDVAGHAAYTVSVSPKHDGGLLGSAQLAWDAFTGVPLKIAVYSRNSSDPVLALQATSIGYGKVSTSVFNIQPPAGDKVVKISAAQQARTASRAHSAARHARGQREVSGLAAVARKVAFSLKAPPHLVGLPRHEVSVLSSGGKPGAVIAYGRNLGGVAVIEQPASGSQQPAQSSEGGQGGLNLPTVSINGATGTELSTALGTVINFRSGGVDYTVIGSVPAAAAEQAARALGTSGP